MEEEPRNRYHWPKFQIPGSSAKDVDEGEGVDKEANGSSSRLTKDLYGDIVRKIRRDSESPRNSPLSDFTRKSPSPEPMDEDISITPEQVVEIVNQLRVEKRAEGYEQSLKGAALRFEIRESVERSTQYESVQFVSDNRFYEGISHKVIERKHAELAIIHDKSGTNASAEWYKLQFNASEWACQMLINEDPVVYKESVEYLKQYYAIYHAQRSQVIADYNNMNANFEQRLKRMDDGINDNDKRERSSPKQDGNRKKFMKG